MSFENPKNGFKFIGNLGTDVKLDKIGDLDKASFRIAVKRNFKEKDGTYGTDWFTIVSLGKQAPVVAKILAKGDQAVVTGTVRVNSYKNKDGKDVEGYDFLLTAFDRLSVRKTGATETETPRKSVNTPAEETPTEDVPF